MFLYKEYLSASSNDMDVLITEGVGTDFEFFKRVLPNVLVIGAGGNSNVVKVLLSVASKTNNTKISVLVDSSAFGSQINFLLRTIEELNSNITVSVLTPESFEWLVLRSYRFPECKQVLDSPYDHCETTKYFSWERLFTDVLKQRMLSKYGVSYDKGDSGKDSKCMNILLSCKNSILSDLGMGSKINKPAGK